MTPSEQTLEEGTRQRFLDAAGEVFADRGFREATIREICRAAGVNIAAVNYHFGDKETLYREVIQNAGRERLQKYPIAGSIDPAASPDQRLRAFIVNYLDRLLDEGRPAWHGKLIAREMVEPTPVLDELVAGFVRPQYERVRSIVTELLGPAALPERVLLCVTSIVGQCLFYKNCRPVLERLLPDRKFDAAERAALAEHIASFSLNAIAGVRGEAERGEGRNGT